jgi:arginine/lysine/ornithine decarboxylase
MTAAREGHDFVLHELGQDELGRKIQSGNEWPRQSETARLRVSLDDLEITNGGYGYQPLMDSIAKRYRVAPEEVVTAAGTTFANHLAMAALIKPGDEVCSNIRPTNRCSHSLITSERT